MATLSEQLPTWITRFGLIRSFCLPTSIAASFRIDSGNLDAPTLTLQGRDGPKRQPTPDPPPPRGHALLRPACQLQWHGPGYAGPVAWRRVYLGNALSVARSNRAGAA